MPRPAATLSLTLALAAAAPALAQQAPAEVDVAAGGGLAVDLEVGFGPGVVAAGRACPVRVGLRLAGDGLPLVGELALETWIDDDPAAPRTVHARAAVELQPGSSKRHLLCFRADEAAGVRVVLRDAGGRVRFRRRVAYGDEPDQLWRLERGVPLYATLRLSAEGERVFWPSALVHYARAGSDRGRLDGAEAVAVHLEPADLAAGVLAGLDALLVPAPPGLSPPAAEAVERFVAAGGRLLLGTGARGGSWPRDSLGPLSPFEVDPAGPALVPGALAALDPEATGEVALLRTRLREGASVGARAPGGQPLAARWRWGKGWVAALAFPLRTPLSDAAFSGLVRRALELSPPPDPLRLTAADALEQDALSDLAEAAGDEGSVRWIGLVLLGLLVTLGPVDYGIWRWRPGPRTTWSALIVTSAGFSALAFALGHTGSEGLVARGVALVDHGPRSPNRPVEALLCLASRRYDRYALALPEGLRVSPAIQPGGEFLPFGGGVPDPRREAAWTLAGATLGVELGVQGVAAFRVSGALAGPPALRLERDRRGAALVNDLPRPVEVIRLAWRRPARTSSLQPGERLELDPSEDGPRMEASPASVDEATLLRRTQEEALVHVDPLVRTSIARLGRVGERPIGQPGRTDLSGELLAGRTVLLVRDGEFPFALTRPDGQPVQVEGSALHRFVVELAPDQGAEPWPLPRPLPAEAPGMLPELPEDLPPEEEEEQE